jgi:hypothetical protein
VTLYVAVVQADGRIRIQQLAKDGLSAIPGAVSPPFPPHPCEAPLLFRRHDTYYALFGHNCPCCPEGSELFVYTAPHPLGPWSGGQDVNRDSSTGQRVVNGQVNDFESLKHKLSFHSNAYVRTNERRAWFTEADDSELQYENSSILLCHVYRFATVCVRGSRRRWGRQRASVPLGDRPVGEWEHARRELAVLGAPLVH